MKKDKKSEIKNEENIEAQETAQAAEPTAEEKLQQQLDEANDKFLRLCAEYDNYRKRTQKEKQDIYTSSRTDILSSFLPVIDNFDRAVENTQAPYEDYKKGIELIHGQFLQILAKEGIEEFGAPGDAFDPNIHNAVMTVEDENLGENVIAEVFSKGYRAGDKILREAVVKVANV